MRPTFLPRPPLRRLIAAVAVLGALGLAWYFVAARRAPAPLAQDVYVWQRVWDAQLHDALRESRDFLAGLGVLGLQRDARGRWVEPAVDLAALVRDGRPLQLVVRLDGSAPDWPAAELAQRVQAVLQRWREAGLAPALQLDHDCATARLGDYAARVAELRRQLPPGQGLSITALPDWLQSPQLETLLASADASTLQVHAVQSPTDGLFDAALAQRWVRAWARRAGARPFRVALPAYGARLKLDAEGGVDAVESEQPLPRRSAQSRELKVDPRAVAGFLRWLERADLPGLAGVTWFRLPRAGDSRAWALATLRAVARGEALFAQLEPRWQAQAGGALDLELHNTGTLDAELPARLELAGDCSAADALPGYRLERAGAGWVLLRTAEGELGAGRGRALGWLRCAARPRLRVGAD
ncbi:DUF3142 domain-containing protein [Tahibacter harae]|uniref:DUF3142 domain-containing protein n=1 Tax=Tahibacter harae TaxID=2963937 RepID=A0ABT1QUA8_9GAMM|nr:DUF3142 domain-containing protein [Tahibacter harae]MCQ4165878.1 DUF3142 domain-containing protein [Tahibacter harae]